ncbi:hypothetical protein L207DRAFT_523543 [Hyaloscypha variabilis F]|uniref:Uncharacterized protein n=1 Tax=Hyaloscypha variabilis (strain UAMH 11265 / GT02V1 / F) TaxID=1149755 RepID=A0A2J6S5S4_HYAVF|nr:hypothetical protein L207DRAFT_523543 [Hyaloscypha variabilis F]
MSPIPARIPSLLTAPLLPAPTVSEYLHHYGSEFDYLTLQDRAAVPTPAPVQERYAQQQYVTLTVTLPSEEIYTTTILLGDSFPTAALPTDPVQQSVDQATLTPAAAQNPSNNGGNVAGIVIGVLGSIAVLAGIYYVYLLRARQLRKISSGTSTITRSSRKKKRKKKKKKRRSSTTTATTVTTTKAPFFTFKLRFFKKKKKKRRKSRRSSMSTTTTGAPAPPAPGPPPPPPPPADGPPPEEPPPAE